MSGGNIHFGEKLARTFVAWSFIAVISLPMAWMLASAFKTPEDILRPDFLPRQLSLENFQKLFAGEFFTWFGNSLIVAGISVPLVIFLGTLAAYSMTRFTYPGRSGIAVAVLFTYMFPSTLMLVPLFLIVADLGLNGTYWALVLANTTFALPFAVWLLRSYFLGVPPEVEEAAMVDGASRLSAFVQVVLPQVMPGIISTSVFAFIQAWDEYMFASIFASGSEMMTLPVGVARYSDELNADWGVLMAASVCSTLPVVVLFAFMQRKLLPDLNAGAVKQ